jgi:hypothetical protein
MGHQTNRMTAEPLAPVQGLKNKPVVGSCVRIHAVQLSHLTTWIMLAVLSWQARSCAKIFFHTLIRPFIFQIFAGPIGCINEPKNNAEMRQHPYAMNPELRPELTHD